MSSSIPHLPTTSGIYKLSCIPNKRIYIGSAVNLQSRKRQHFHDLRQNKHCNRHLQRAWDKYGEQAFTFEVLELVLSLSLTEREQYWLNKLKPFGRKGFNIAHEAGSNLGTKRSPEICEKMGQWQRGKKQAPELIEKRIAPLRGRKFPGRGFFGKRQHGRKHTPESREKIRQAKLSKKHTPEARENMRHAQLGKKRSPETREKIRQASTGRKHTPETREKLRQAWQRRKQTLEDAGD